jgi:hypothetical protein
VSVPAGALAVGATPAALATPSVAMPLALTGCQPTAPKLPWPVLRIGSRGADVTALQHMLRGWSDINRFSLAADGVYGPRTAPAGRALGQRLADERADLLDLQQEPAVPLQQRHDVQRPEVAPAAVVRSLSPGTRSPSPCSQATGHQRATTAETAKHKAVLSGQFF